MLKKRILLPILLIFLCNASISYAEAHENNTYIPVLMYHHIAEEFEPNQSPSIISPDNFRLHMEYLISNGFTAISFHDLEAANKDLLQLPDKPIIITFDDGYESNYTYAYPILKELGMKATINVVVSSRSKTPGDFYHFDWTEAKEMIDSGIIEIGSHTYDLHSNILLKSDEETELEYSNRLYWDFRLSKKLIDNFLGINTNILAFPYGYNNEHITSAAKKAGFETLITIDRGLMKPGDSLNHVKRINVDGYDTPEDIISKINSFIVDKQ